MTRNPSDPLVFLNSKIIPPAYAHVGALSSASLYGKGVFTTIAIYDGKPFLWEKHWRRLGENAGRLGIDLSEFSEGPVKAGLAELIEANRVVNGRARMTFYDESANSNWRFESSRNTSLLIITGAFRPNPENLRLGISPSLLSSSSPLRGMKSCNYLEGLLALESIVGEGFDEAIRINERDEIVSACTANVFWLIRGNLHTSNLKTGCLPGTTREFILENLECDEVETGVETLKVADSIFLTSAGIGVVQASEFAGRVLTKEPHEILNVLPH